MSIIEGHHSEWWPASRSLAKGSIDFWSVCRYVTIFVYMFACMFVSSGSHSSGFVEPISSLFGTWAMGNITANPAHKQSADVTIPHIMTGDKLCRRARETDEERTVRLQAMTARFLIGKLVKLERSVPIGCKHCTSVG